MRRWNPSKQTAISTATTLLGVLFSLDAMAQEPPAPDLSSDPAPVAAPTAPPVVKSAAADAPLAGFHNGIFYLRDKTDTFRLYVQGRVHVDAVTSFGPGLGGLSSDNALKSGLTLRRIRPELGGEFFQDWQWQISADFGPLGTDNPGARAATRDCAADATTGVLTCSDRSAAVESTQIRAAGTDAFINFAPSTWFNVQAGQYLTPFGMEARFSDNTTPYLERALVVRTLAAPFTRDIGAMIWGESPNKTLYYTIGLYNGDGPNRPNQDNRFDYSARAVSRPFAADKHSPLHDAQIGVSGRYGTRDPKLIGYDQPSLTTQGGFAFWKATYRDSVNRTVHIIPSAEQGAIGADLHVPIDRLDFSGEFVYSHVNTREALDGLQLSPFTERTGTLKGWGYYAQLGVWILGSRDIIGGGPSYGKPLHLDLASPEKKPRHGLQALVKFEQLHLSYNGSGRGGQSDAKTPNGDIDVIALTLGANYWATRHLRLGINYGFYNFPDSAPTTASATGGPTQNSGQRAIAPAQNLVKGVNDAARDSGHVLHELSVRAGVQF